MVTTKRRVYVLVVAALLCGVAFTQSDLFVIVRAGSAEEVLGALRAGANVNARNEDAETPLLHAARHDANHEVLRVLLDAGANVDARDSDGRTSLMHAAGGEPSIEVLRVLLDAGANVDARDNDGWPPLMYALRSNPPVEVVRVLLDAGAPVQPYLVDIWPDSERSRQMQTVHLLGLAARSVQDPEVLQLLINAGADADINTTERWGWTALMGAARENPNAEVVRVLLDAGERVNVRGPDHENHPFRGMTPLILAVSHNPSIDVVRLLIEAGADLEVRGGIPGYGMTPLMWAARSADPEVVRLLIEAGADVNAESEHLGYYRTPLMYAARTSEYPEVVHLLLDAGADAGATAFAPSRNRAIDLARENEHLQGTDAYWRLHDASFD